MKPFITLLTVLSFAVPAISSQNETLAKMKEVDARLGEVTGPLTLNPNECLAVADETHEEFAIDTTLRNKVFAAIVLAYVGGQIYKHDLARLLETLKNEKNYLRVLPELEADIRHKTQKLAINKIVFENEYANKEALNDITDGLKMEKNGIDIKATNPALYDRLSANLGRKYQHGDAARMFDPDNFFADSNKLKVAEWKRLRAVEDMMLAQDAVSESEIALKAAQATKVHPIKLFSITDTAVAKLSAFGILSLVAGQIALSKEYYPPETNPKTFEERTKENPGVTCQDTSEVARTYKNILAKMKFLKTSLSTSVSGSSVSAVR